MEGPRVRKLHEALDKCLSEITAATMSNSAALLQECFPVLSQSHGGYLQELLRDVLLAVKFNSAVRPRRGGVWSLRPLCSAATPRRMSAL